MFDAGTKVIVVGICAGPTAKAEEIAVPSVVRCLGGPTEVIVVRDQRCIADAYNEILSRSEAINDLEAVVLIHDDVELLDVHTRERLLTEFEDPTVGLVGVIGARGMSDLRWHEFEARGAVRTGDGDLWYDPVNDFVDGVDGLLLAISPIAAKMVRFDNRVCRQFHGYDADYSFAMRAAGWKVRVAPIDVMHHATGAKNFLSLREATLLWRLKWRADVAVSTRIRWRIALQLTTTEIQVRRFRIGRDAFMMARRARSWIAR